MGARSSIESESAANAQFSFGNGKGTLGRLDDVIFLRLPEVKAVTGLSKTSLYGLIRDRNFPAPVRVGPRAVAWVKSEVKQWAANRVLASRSGPYSQNGKRMPHSVHPEAEASSKKFA
jgi:prophage regulatory protein